MPPLDKKIKKRYAQTFYLKKKKRKKVTAEQFQSERVERGVKNGKVNNSRECGTCSPWRN